MANVLEKICADKRKEVAELKVTLPLSDFKDDLVPSERSFYKALASSGTSYIFECKKASPSKGLIRENFDLDEITTAYAKEAACFSVLTDEKYFQGKHEYLEYVISKVEQPVLNKDFFVEAYQVHLARKLGANAVLLMLSVLNDSEYTELSEIAASYKMDVLTEVSNLEETNRALELGAKIIGINNRNLRDLSTDLSTTEDLVPVIREHHDFDGVIISESGIYTHEDVCRLSPLVDGFLVGSALMAQQDLDKAIKQLVYGSVKVCGVSSKTQAELIAQYPVQYMGLIFVPNTPRYVSLESALEITKDVPHQYVGVFLDHPIELVAQYAHKLGLAAVQLHGSESETYMRELSPLLPNKCEIWKVSGVDANISEDSLHENLKHLHYLIEKGLVHKLVLDCKVGAQSGGTGQSFDWRLLDSIPHKDHTILAGGVGPENAHQADLLHVAVLDANSKLESAPAKKDPKLLSDFFEQLRA